MGVLVNKIKMIKETLKDWGGAFVTICGCALFICAVVQLFINIGFIKLHSGDSLPVCLATVNGGYLIPMVNVTEDGYKCKEGTDLYIIPVYKTVVK